MSTRKAPTTDYPMTIYHKPNCSTSRNVLQLIRESGVEPEVIEYLKDPPTRERLVEQQHQRQRAFGIVHP